MTTTTLSLNVIVKDGDSPPVADVFGDLTALATMYTGSYAGVSVSAYAAPADQPEPSEDDLGRAAYDAHISTLQAAELLDDGVDDFDDLHPDHRRAWIQAALAARNA
jgi:hypothetical protein